MMNNKYFLSVLMSVYNSEITIEKSIKSIINQSYKNFEFLIMDDFSNDRTCGRVPSKGLREKPENSLKRNPCCKKHERSPQIIGCLEVRLQCNKIKTFEDWQYEMK